MPHVQDVMQVLLTRLTCTEFSLAYRSVHAAARNLPDRTALLICVLSLVLTALSICPVPPTIAVLACLHNEVRPLILGGTRRRQVRSGGHFNGDLRPLQAGWLGGPFTMLPSKRCSQRVTCPWLCIWRKCDDVPNSLVSSKACRCSRTGCACNFWCRCAQRLHHVFIQSLCLSHPPLTFNGYVQHVGMAACCCLLVLWFASSCSELQSNTTLRLAVSSATRLTSKRKTSDCANRERQLRQSSLDPVALQLDLAIRRRILRQTCPRW